MKRITDPAQDVGTRSMRPVQSMGLWETVERVDNTPEPILVGDATPSDWGALEEVLKEQQ